MCRGLHNRNGGWTDSRLFLREKPPQNRKVQGKPQNIVTDQTARTARKKTRRNRQHPQKPHHQTLTQNLQMKF